MSTTEVWSLVTVTHFVFVLVVVDGRACSGNTIKLGVPNIDLLPLDSLELASELFHLWQVTQGSRCVQKGGAVVLQRESVIRIKQERPGPQV